MKISAGSLLAALGTIDRALITFNFVYDDVHEHIRPWAKRCYNKQIKRTITEAAAFLD